MAAPGISSRQPRQTAAWFAGRRPTACAIAALAAGFNTNALFLTDELIWHVGARRRRHGTVWPTNDVSRWLLKRFVTRTDDQWYVMGLVYPAAGHTDPAALASLSAELAQNQILLSGWSLLGATTLKRVQDRMWLVVAPMALLVMTSLWLAFRRAAEIFLGLAVLLLGGLCLLAVMAVAGWSWNLLNLMAVPLLLGTGVDYGIFMQLALRRHGGDVSLVRRSIGRALLLCGGTAIAGFRLAGLVRQRRAWPASAKSAPPASPPTCSSPFFCCRRGGCNGILPAKRSERQRLRRRSFTERGCGGWDLRASGFCRSSC